MKEDKPQEVVNTEYGFPFKGRYCITSIYGWDNDRYHDALDMFSYTNDDVYSVCDGTVYFAGWDEGYVHCFLDGRDTPPQSAKGFAEDLEAEIKKIGVGKIASVSGRVVGGISLV